VTLVLGDLSCPGNIRRKGTNVMLHAIRLVPCIEDAPFFRHRAEVRTSAGELRFLTLPYASRRMAVLMALHWAHSCRIPITPSAEIDARMLGLFSPRGDAVDAFLDSR
jgi:hypothetical protein